MVFLHTVSGVAAAVYWWWPRDKSTPIKTRNPMPDAKYKELIETCKGKVEELKTKINECNKILQEMEKLLKGK